MSDIFNTVFKYKEKLSPDKLGAYPERIHVKAMPERRYLWSSRVLVILAIFSICLNMMLTSTILLLTPQRSSAPQMFYINDKFNRLDILEPSEIDVQAFNLITEEQIRNYIMYRYLITSRYDELVSRWSAGSPVFWMSSTAVFSNFKDGEAKQGMTLQRLRGLQRDVEIDWITQIARGVWQVQFRTLDYYPDSEEADVIIWRATMRVSYANINYPNKTFAMRNPFSMVINNYSLAYHGKPDASEHYLSEARRTARKRSGR